MRAWSLVALVAAAVAGCGGADPPGADAARRDAGSTDAGVAADGGGSDGGGSDGGAADGGGGDLDAAPGDAAPGDGGAAADAEPRFDAGPPAIDAGSDAGVPSEMRYCVDIFVSNTCEMSVTPTEITIPRDQIAYFCWRNTSRDYPVDVWLSYGGGYTDLAPGATWNEPPGHCLGPLVHDEYADISTACSEHRFLIHCL